MSKRVIIIGGGASGLFAAGIAVKNGADVMVIERNETPARKVLITGKGRCNVTNACFDINELISNVPTNPRFLYSAFNAFSPADTMAFFEDLGVPLKVERGNRVFPVSDKARDIADALIKFGLSSADLLKGRVTDFITENNRIIAVKTENGLTVKGDVFILATGGKSYKNTGSSGDGYKLARSVGHTVVPVRPSLVALVSNSPYCKQMQGLSLKNSSLKLLVNNKCIYEDFGEMLFTHFGVSGPMILSASAHLNLQSVKGAELLIDVKPALSAEQLDKRILSEFSQNNNKNIENVLPSLMPHKMIDSVMSMSRIEKYTKVNQITKEQRHALIASLKSMRIIVEDFYNLDSAIITCGGVNTKEINPKTMGSKIFENLYFAGEVIDVDAYTGGFNLQIAFSTAYLAGKNASI